MAAPIRRIQNASLHSTLSELQFLEAVVVSRDDIPVSNTAVRKIVAHWNAGRYPDQPSSRLRTIKHHDLVIVLCVERRDSYAPD